MENKKEFELVLEILIPVLKKFRNPLSVSFLNLQFVGKFRIKNAINESFMKLFKDQFIFCVIGDDIKIRLRNADDQWSNEIKGKEKDITEITKIFEKNSKKVNDIKDAMENEMKFKDFSKKFSSKKYAVNLPFILRNSDCLHIYLKGENTFIEPVNGSFKEEIPEEEFWNFLNTEGLKMFVLQRLLNVFRKFKSPLNQGILQSCFNFGNILIDGRFMTVYSKYFIKEDDTDFTLKEEYRYIVKDIETSSNLQNELGSSSSNDNVVSPHKKSTPEKVQKIATAETSLSSALTKLAINHPDPDISQTQSEIKLVETSVETSDSSDETSDSSDEENTENLDFGMNEKIIDQNEIRLEAAMKEQRSIIIIGENFDENDLVIDSFNGSESEKRRLLLNLKRDIDLEICK